MTEGHQANEVAHLDGHGGKDSHQEAASPERDQPGNDLLLGEDMQPHCGTAHAPAPQDLQEAVIDGEAQAAIVKSESEQLTHQNETEQTPSAKRKREHETMNEPVEPFEPKTVMWARLKGYPHWPVSHILSGVGPCSEPIVTRR